MVIAFPSDQRAALAESSLFGLWCAQRKRHLFNAAWQRGIIAQLPCHKTDLNASFAVSILLFASGVDQAW